MATGRSAVITGAGCVTALGSGLDPFWDGILSAAQPAGMQEIGGAPYPVAAVSDYSHNPAIPRNLAHLLDRGSTFALDAALRAVQQAGLSAGSIDSRRLAVVDGLPMRAPGTSTMVVPYGQLIGRTLGVKGPVVAVGAGDASGAVALSAALDLLATDQADVVIAGASQVLQSELLELLAAQGSLTAGEYRPLDKERSGMLAGEAAAYLVLEQTAERASIVGVQPLAALAGASHFFDPLVEPFAVSGAEAVGRAIQTALLRAGLVQASIDLFIAGASGASADTNETAAVRRTFGNHVYTAASSFKASTGHPFAAAGPLQAIAAALAVVHQRAFPTANLREADVDDTLEMVLEAQDLDLTHILTTVAGLGGQNAALVVSRWTEE